MNSMHRRWKWGKKCGDTRLGTIYLRLCKSQIDSEFWILLFCFLVNFYEADDMFKITYSWKSRADNRGFFYQHFPIS